MKLDRFMARHQSMGRTAAHHAIAARRVKVDGRIVLDGHHEVDRFSAVELDGEPLRQAVPALHIMLHKPAGHVSATKDEVLPTVLDLIDHPGKAGLHLAGRLDRATSGLVLLTNDGRWSKRITESAHQVPKVYLVETVEPLKESDVEAFAQGFHFHTEDITTQPAWLEILGERLARVTLFEGRYHQIKRMFHRVHNRVAGLHRESIGGLALPEGLEPGRWRVLTAREVELVLEPKQAWPEAGVADE